MTNAGVMPTLIVQSAPSAGSSVLFTNNGELLIEITRIKVAVHDTSAVDLELFYVDDGSSATDDNMVFNAENLVFGTSLDLGGDCGTYGLVMTPGSTLTQTNDGGNLTISIWGRSQSIAPASLASARVSKAHPAVFAARRGAR